MSQSQPSLTRLATQGALWAGFSQYFFFALGFGKTVLLSRLVGVEYFGLLAVATVWASYFTLARLDLRVAILSSPEEPSTLDAQFWLENLSALIGLALAGTTFVVWPGIVPAGAWPLISILLAATLFETLTSTSLYLVEKRLRQDVLGRLMVFASVVSFAVPLMLAFAGLPLPALVTDALLPLLIINTGAALFVRWRPTFVWDRQQLQSQLRLGWTLWSSGVFSKITFQFDDWLVGNLNRPHPTPWLASGVVAEGFYSRAYNVGKMPMDVVAGMIGRIALSLYAESAARGREVLQKAYQQLTWVLTWIVFSSSAVAFVTADEVITLLLGERWLPMAPLFRLMLLFVLGRPLFQNNAQLLVAMRAEGSFRRAMIWQAIFILITCPPAVLIWGAAGASVVVSLMAVVGVITTDRYVGHHLGISAWRSYLVPALAFALTVGGVALLAPLMPAKLWVAAMVKGIGSAAVFGAALYLFEHRSLRDAWSILRQGLRPER